jgi:hypothetical protein
MGHWMVVIRFLLEPHYLNWSADQGKEPRALATAASNGGPDRAGLGYKAAAGPWPLPDTNDASRTRSHGEIKSAKTARLAETGNRGCLAELRLTLPLMALLRIKRPEHLKEGDPAVFGRLRGSTERWKKLPNLCEKLTRAAGP